MPAPATCVVLGLGNTLHSDDGIGPQAIERLRRDARVPADVALIEGGTLGLELLTYIWDCSYLLVLDAVDVGQPPGTLVRMSSQEVQTLPGKGSAHQLGVADLLVVTLNGLSFRPKGGICFFSPAANAGEMPIPLKEFLTKRW